MKKLIIALLFIIICNYPAKSQGALTYSQVIQFDSINASTLYQSAKQWFILSFPSPKKVIQDDNPGLNMITGRGSLEFSTGRLLYLSYEGYLEYTVQIQARDNRVKVDITNITHINLPGNAPSSRLGLITDEEKQFKKGLSSGYHNAVAEKIKEKMSVYSKVLFLDIEKFIRNYKSKEVQDW